MGTIVFHFCGNPFQKWMISKDFRQKQEFSLAFEWKYDKMQKDIGR